MRAPSPILSFLAVCGLCVAFQPALGPLNEQQLEWRTPSTEHLHPLLHQSPAW